MHAATPTFSETVDVIRSEHINAAKVAVRNPELLKELEAEIDRDCESIRSFLFATQVSASKMLHASLTIDVNPVQVIDEISPRSRDSIIGFGERLGCKLVATILRDRVCLLLCTT